MGALLAAVGFLLGWSVHPTPYLAPQAASVPSAEVGAATPAEAATASMMIDFGDGDVRTWSGVAINDGETVLDLTRSLSGDGGFALKEEPPGKYGVMVDAIGDKINGSDGGKYWTFYVNDAMGDRSSDATALAPGDVVEWKFVKLVPDGSSAQ